MSDLQSVLSDARLLSEADRLLLIDALWETVPPVTNLQLHPDWKEELERRVAAIDAGTATTTPWETIRAEALARLKHGQTH